MSRVALKDTAITDGSVIHKGSVVAIAPKATHYNAQIYDQPEMFDPFRFAKMRQAGGIEGKQAFTALSNDYLLFGVG
jgi:cytochrome P450